MSEGKGEKMTEIKHKNECDVCELEESISRLIEQLALDLEETERFIEILQRQLHKVKGEQK
jgi:hypothetical protein